MNLSRIFIERPVATAVLVAALCFFGWFAFRTLPVNDLPTVDFPTLSVSASLPGADPETMATAVAIPLERQFTTISGLDSMNSVSSSGSTRISLQFNLERDIDSAAQDVQSAIATAMRRLPEGIDPPQLRKVNPTDNPVLHLALTAETMPLTELNEFADNRLAQRLSTLPGVAQVVVYGSQKYAVRIYLNPNALAQRKLGLDKVVSALQAANSNRPSGVMEGAERSFPVKADADLKKAADFQNVIVAYQNGAPVRLKDLGRATDSVENNKTVSWFNGNRSIILAIQRQPGANTVEVVRGIRELLPEVREQLPPGVDLDVLSDRSEFIAESIHDVNFTLMLAIGLVVAVILVFLRNLSSTLITALILPASVLGTFAVIYLLGYSLNNLSLMALTLAVGFVVDDAIVVLENINRHMEMGKDRLTATLDGTREIGFTIVSMTLSLSAVFIPILFMGGILGRLFEEFAVTVGVAVLISGLVSLSLTPMLCSLFLKRTHEHGRAYRALEAIFERSRYGYQQSLEWAMRHRGLMLFGSATILAATAWLAIIVPKGFIPNQDTGVIAGNTRAPEGIAFDELVQHQRAVTETIRENPNVAALMSTAGQGTGGVTGGNIGRVVIRLKARAERDVTADEVIAQLRKAVDEIEGMQLILQNPPAIRLGSIVASGNYQVVLLGSDLPTLYQATEALEERMKALPILEDVNSSLELRNPEIQVHILRDKAAALGVSPGQIESALNSAFGGREISTIYGASDQYHVYLELAKDYQRDVNALNAIYVQNASGQLVPLTSVAEIKTGVGPVSIQHYGQLPSTTLSFNLAPGNSIGAALTMIEDLGRQTLPKGISTALEGSARTFAESMRDLPILLGVTILVIYMILAILYEHLGHPLTILTALPLAGFGALVMLLLFHQELNIFSFVGIILLVGLVKKNGIMMVDFALHLQREKKLAPERAIVEASVVRFRPIMMTTLAALLATLPIAIGYGAGGEARQPLGIAVVGGLLFSQFLTLYITPTFYVSLERVVQWWRASRPHRSASSPTR
ncbi:MAG: efflux RND transporter permease subunit [Burkholderiales bacterium]